jgi:uncharacterized protein (DUF1778 family)
MSTTSVLSVRLDDKERALLEAAADDARTTLSDFVRRKAIEAAELEVMDRRVVSIPAKDWEKFESWLQSPPKEMPALKRLMRKRPSWER